MKRKKKDYTKLADKMAKANSGSKNFKQDERFWYPERDKVGNAYAVIRFLPPSENEDMSFVKRFNHGFEDVGGWYIEECPTTIGGNCPICERNNVIVKSFGGWSDTPEDSKKICSKRKRKIQYVSNIYIVKDSENPENEGKVFLFRYGTKIFDKLMAAISPKFEDETPIDPFDLWVGANFKLKVSKIDNQVNYDASAFDSVSELVPGDDDAMEKIWKTQHLLNSLIAPEVYKSYEDLESRAAQVLGDIFSGSKGPSQTAEGMMERTKEGDIPFTPDEKKEVKQESAPAADADTLAYFENLAES